MSLPASVKRHPALPPLIEEDCPKFVDRSSRSASAPLHLIPKKHPSTWLDGLRERQNSAWLSSSRGRELSRAIELDLRPLTEPEESWMHSGWRARRAATLEAMKRTGTGSNAIARFETCGGNAWVEQCVGTDEHRVRCQRCKSRWCVICGVRKSATVRDAVLARCLPDTELRFVTMTLAHTAMTLRQMLDRLRECFRKLRSRPFWKSRVTGGIAVTEIKLSKANKWHVHVHCILEGSYIPQGELSREWHVCTGDSTIVDVRAIPDLQARIAYVAKYVGKAADGSMFVPGRERWLDEMMVALRGTRTVTCIGAWHGMDLEADEDKTKEWKSLGPLDSMIARAINGEVWATGVLRSLKRDWEPEGQTYGNHASDTS